MIHKYKKFNYYIVLDVNSGSVHVVDEITYRLLDFYDDDGNADIKAINELENIYDKEEIREASSEIENLYKAGVLFAPDKHKELAKNLNKQVNIKALCLHVAHDCNLSCEYCFANKGDYTGNKGLMSFEVGKAAIDFVIKASGSRKNIEIDFFGGEPLLNFENTCKILEYAEKKGKENNKLFRFTITTNGVLLSDDKITYINEHMSNIVLSIDGRKQVNDNVRKRLDGSGTYDSIMPKFKKVAKSRNQDNYYVRGTYTGLNLDFAKDVIHLADEGFLQISIEPVVAPDGCGYELNEEDIPKLFEEYDKLADEMQKRNREGRGFNFFHFMIDLTGGPCAIKRISGCGAGHEYVAITPEGDIYPCHQFVGQEQQKIGNVLDGTLDMKRCEEFASFNVYSKEACSSCWARFYCSGGCLATSANYAGGLDKPYKIGCELEKKRVECAIALKVDEMFAKNV